MSDKVARLRAAGLAFLSELDFHVRVGLRYPHGLARSLQRVAAALEDFWAAWELDSRLVSPAEAQEVKALTEVVFGVSGVMIRRMRSAEHSGLEDPGDSAASPCSSSRGAGLAESPTAA
jgi:hypothetical protein